jgi:hypothetical protein
MTPNNLKVCLVYFLIINFSFAQETEEVISVASYIESSEQNASPVDVISADDFKNLRVSRSGNGKYYTAWHGSRINLSFD